MSPARTWWPIALSLVAAVTLLYAVVLPGGYLTWLRLAMLLWTVAAVVWAVSLTGRSWLVRSILPAVSVVTMVLACSGVPGKLLFPLYRPALERQPGSVGLYHFSAVWTHDGCVAYVTDDSGMSSFSGLLHCTPSVKPSPRLGDTARDAVFDSLGDDWYAFIVPRSGPPVWGFNPFAVGAVPHV
ncbi:hypothetical protein BJ973_004198 [Actinoplanes tereljensis]|uniref:Uncharacterized protein n=1 Tax=Paractinoplanes tereljensis TaxID=571912 RepID=A0A919NR42_9ACTN|nr:hypothetical protein [Actinoplanes tereljensis]GIF23589.1 hypothetical protein Ate02nite_63190 [Actinoplanes tereljensis]